MKTCPKCGITKERTEFSRASDRRDGLRATCRECNREGNRASCKRWREAHPERQSASARAWRTKYPERADAATKRWRATNPDKVVAAEKAHRDRTRARHVEVAKARKKHRLATDPVFAVAYRCRTRVNKVLREARVGKPARRIDILGCSDKEFVAYLEARFLPGMAWENRKEWHIDHIRPLASFDLTDPGQVFLAFHYSNCQPLWARDNLVKSARY